MLVLQGEPKSTNHIYKVVSRGRFASVYMSKEGKSLKMMYQWQCKAQWQKETLLGPISLEIRLYFGVNRNHDIDNYNKILLDSLSGIVYKDDGQIQKLTISKFLDKKEPRIEIDVYPQV